MWHLLMIQTLALRYAVQTLTTLTPVREESVNWAILGTANSMTPMGIQQQLVLEQTTVWCIQARQRPRTALTTSQLGCLGRWLGLGPARRNAGS